jgi:hypothetical protein
MQYALLICEAPGAYDGLTDQERQAISAEYLALRGEAGMFGGAKLAPVETATTVRAADGDALVTDGPFADTKEVFGGYFLFEADDVDAALAIASRMPAVRFGGSVEIRPLEFVT